MSKRDIQDEIRYLQDINCRTFAEEDRLRDMLDRLQNWGLDNEEES